MPEAQQPPVLGLDVSGSSLGWAVLLGHKRCAGAGAIPVREDDCVPALVNAADRLLVELAQILPTSTPLRIGIEQPPPVVAKKFGKQLHSGWRVGIASGIVLGRILGFYTKTPVEAVAVLPVDDWRKAVLAGPKTTLAAAPLPSLAGALKRDSESGAIEATYTCGHVSKFMRIDELLVTCSACSRGAAKDSREEWKRLAVDYVLSAYPGALDLAIRAARSRARNAKVHEAQLVGVDDAAEAVCIAEARQKENSSWT